MKELRLGVKYVGVMSESDKDNGWSCDGDQMGFMVFWGLLKCY